MTHAPPRRIAGNVVLRTASSTNARRRRRTEIAAELRKTWRCPRAQSATSRVPVAASTREAVASQHRRTRHATISSPCSICAGLEILDGGHATALDVPAPTMSWSADSGRRASRRGSIMFATIFARARRQMPTRSLKRFCVGRQGRGIVCSGGASHRRAEIRRFVACDA